MKTIKLFTIILALFLTACELEPELPATTDIRAEISGEWACSEVETGQDPIDFTVKVFKDSESETKILIADFHNIEDTAYAIVGDDRSLTIPQQTLGGYSNITGTGSINSGYTQIDLTYTAVEQGETINYTATFTTGTISKMLR